MNFIFPLKIVDTTEILVNNKILPLIIKILINFIIKIRITGTILVMINYINFIIKTRIGEMIQLKSNYYAHRKIPIMTFILIDRINLKIKIY
jgi:hypothetical protein